MVAGSIVVILSCIGTIIGIWIGTKKGDPISILKVAGTFVAIAIMGAAIYVLGDQTKSSEDNQANLVKASKDNASHTDSSITNVSDTLKNQLSKQADTNKKALAGSIEKKGKEGIDSLGSTERRLKMATYDAASRIEKNFKSYKDSVAEASVPKVGLWRGSVPNPWIKKNSGSNSDSLIVGVANRGAPVHQIIVSASLITKERGTGSYFVIYNTSPYKFPVDLLIEQGSEGVKVEGKVDNIFTFTDTVYLYISVQYKNKKDSSSGFHRFYLITPNQIGKDLNFAGDEEEPLQKYLTKSGYWIN